MIPAKLHPPRWFTHAVKTAAEDRFIHVENCRIHYLRWGEANQPGLVLVHGGGAHAHWWDFIAPFFAERYRVAAMDLSGMGDSGYRPLYSTATFAHEVMSVCAAAGFGSRPVIVGHSFGGFVALKAGLMHGEKLSGIVLVDSPVRPPDYDWAQDLKRSPIKPKQVYPTLEEALRRFKLMPAQPCDNDYILDYIARHSLARVDGGWTWKFDDQLFKDFQVGNMSAELGKLTCRVGVIYGDRSELFTPEIADHMFQVLRRSASFIPIPEAHHHLFLDQPLAFVAAVRTLLEEWRHSDPRPRK